MKLDVVAERAQEPGDVRAAASTRPDGGNRAVAPIRLEPRTGRLLLPGPGWGASMVPVASSCHRPPVEQFTARQQARDRRPAGSAPAWCAQPYPDRHQCTSRSARHDPIARSIRYASTWSSTICCHSGKGGPATGQGSITPALLSSVSRWTRRPGRPRRRLGTAALAGREGYRVRARVALSMRSPRSSTLASR